MRDLYAVKISLGICRSRVLSHVPRMSSLSLPLLLLTAPDRSSWALIGLERSFLCLQLFLPLNSLPPTTICFVLVFESFLLCGVFHARWVSAASASLASSSGVSVSRGFPGFLVRVAWSVLVPGELSCCGVCGGLLCVGRPLACATGVSVFGLSCRVSVCSGLVRLPALVGALRPLLWWVSLCRALASSVWSFLRCVCCRPGFDHCRFDVSARCVPSAVLFSPRCPCRCLPVGLGGVLSVFCSGSLGSGCARYGGVALAFMS